MYMVREFYAAMLLVRNILYPGWGVTIRNTWVLFLSNKLVRFVGYKRPVDAFPVITLSEEDRPLASKVF